jgi:hypothetical protein
MEIVPSTREMELPDNYEKTPSGLWKCVECTAKKALKLVLLPFPSNGARKILGTP